MYIRECSLTVEESKRFGVTKLRDSVKRIDGDKIRKKCFVTQASINE